MQTDEWDLFAEADVYYRAGQRGFVNWGANGIAILRRLEALTQFRLKPLGYVEIGLPTLCVFESLTRMLGEKAAHVYRVLDEKAPELALAPFSDLQYVKHALDMGDRAPHLRRALVWSHRFVREISGGMLDFGEYVKCEVFSLHSSLRDATAAGAALARALRTICTLDLDLSPLFGIRPRRTAFPGTEDTWAAELPLAGGDVQTLMVSHRMKPSFFDLNGFAATEGTRLNSSCFSQKLLCAVLLHHRDAHGFRFPPALAPTIGLLSANGGGVPAARLIDRKIGTLDRVVRLDSENVVTEMIRRGAAWAIQPFRSSARSPLVWQLHARTHPAAAASIFENLDVALLAARRETTALQHALRRDSRRRLRELFVASDFRDFVRDSSSARHPAIAAPCCSRATCRTAVLDTPNWIPKLLAESAIARPCIVCTADTRGLIVFEAEERYTSFYHPTREVADRRNT